jgi:LysR family transcriptional regulator, chromosome initiation inhibitor
MNTSYICFINIRNTYFMLDYPSLFALAAVVREGSFERAARALHVTPSAVSQRIRLLEERAGCALVVRGQPCEATEAGRRLCQHVDRVRLLEHELQGDLPALGTTEQVWVQVPVAVNADSLATWFMQALTDFATQTTALVQLSVDNEGHTAEWLRSGAVLAAVTAVEQPASGCNSHPLGAMRYVAAASPAFVAHYFPQGVDARRLEAAPSLMFNAKDELQQQWVLRQCGRHVELPRHTLPSPQGFVAAALAGMGWALHPLALVAPYLARGQLVELAPDTPLDIPLYWQQARATSSLLQGLSRAVVQAAADGLRREPFEGVSTLSS